MFGGKLLPPIGRPQAQPTQNVAGSTPLRVAFKRRAYTLARRLVQLHADLDQAHRLPKHLGSVLEGKWDPLFHLKYYNLARSQLK